MGAAIDSLDPGPAGLEVNASHQVGHGRGLDRYLLVRRPLGALLRGDIPPKAGAVNPVAQRGVPDHPLGLLPATAIELT
jgi:hypothetical protein